MASRPCPSSTGTRDCSPRSVARLGRFEFSGLLAWLLWAFVHVFYLISYRSRALVMFEWIWLYFTRQRGARVILERSRPS